MNTFHHQFIRSISNGLSVADVRRRWPWGDEETANYRQSKKECGWLGHTSSAGSGMWSNSKGNISNVVSDIA